MMKKYLKKYWIYGALAVLVVSGAMMNKLVIAANNGNMPVPWVVDKSLIMEYCSFPYLADILPFYTSIGDWLIWLGLTAYTVILVVNLLQNRVKYEKV